VLQQYFLQLFRPVHFSADKDLIRRVASNHFKVADTSNEGAWFQILLLEA